MKFLVVLLALPLALAAPAVEALAARADGSEEKFLFERRACSCQNQETGELTAAGVCWAVNGVTDGPNGTELGWCRPLTAPPVDMEKIFIKGLCEEYYGKDYKPVCKWIRLCDNGTRSPAGTTYMQVCSA
ncbi:hypothetical protein MAPG_00168 [Magnaporthiopsis poae ATCC 64411]|uniref:Avirulence Effector AvrLm4-7 domain-containing protein n=1 Tax=Magnaporthiopsis poae (strain ATCC 64411 / 73-15) TaxID=644358 RepID=A0A0C4DKA3_MAGP6|nr:hypothetical protein MAPG_00168 [Magnaporthiopsis poae ATCC 64411]